MKPVLLGMNNPVSSKPEHALFPYPPGCTGHRILAMINSVTPVTRGEYLRAFDRVNLVNGKTWRAGEAALNALEITRQLQGREVVVFGADARHAIGLPPLLVHPLIWRGVKWRQLPHPSGRNLWYNDETCRALAAALLSELYLSTKVEETINELDIARAERELAVGARRADVDCDWHSGT